MKLICLFFLSFWIGIGGHCQSFTFNKGGTSAKNYFEEIPYEAIKNKIVINVEVAGKKHRFLFDTGAPMAIGDDLAEELAIPSLARVSTTDANGVSDSIDVVFLKEIKLGDIIFTDVPAMRFIPDLFECWNIDGVIGSNILRNSIVQIVPERKVIVLTDNAAKLSLNKKNSLPMIVNRGPQSYPFINIQFRSKQGKAAIELGFDTGGDEFISLPEDYLDQIAQAHVYEIAERGFGTHNYSEFGLAEPDTLLRVRVPRLTIADASFSNLITETHKQGLARMGARVLNYGRVTLDFIHSKFYFEATRPANDLNEGEWPLYPAIVNNKVLVGVVWDSMKERIKVGEQIVAIGNKSLPLMDICDWINNDYMPADKKELMLTIKGEDGSTREVKIERK